MARTPGNGTTGETRPLTICQVMAGGGDGGGLEKHFVELCNQLALRHRVVAIAHDGFAGQFNPAVHFADIDLSGGRINPVTLWRLLRLLRRYRPHIVHAQASKAAAMVGHLGPALAAGRVATLHNQKHSTRMFKGFDGVIAVSKGVADTLGSIPAEVIYNGIRPPRPIKGNRPYRLAAASGKRLEGPLVAVVGRLVAAKGVDILIDAWQQVQDAHLLVVGEGPDRADLETQIRTLGLQDRVHLLGQHKRVPELLAGVDLVVISSRREGFSYVFAEALHMEIPVVATRVPVADEILPDAFLVPCNDGAALAACINQVLAHRQETRQQFAPIWRFARERLTLDHMAAQTEDLYRRVLMRKSGPDTMSPELATCDDRAPTGVEAERPKR